MITALVAAALLQSAVPAQCRLDNSLPDPCQVVFATDAVTSQVGVGFVFDYGQILIVGRKTSDSSFSTELFQISDVSPVASTGECKITSKRIACVVRIQDQTMKIEAVTQ